MADTGNPLDALNGANGGNEDGTDYKARYDELNRRYQSERVEAGRLKKANEEIAQLRAQLGELTAQKRMETALGALDEEDRNNIPDDYQRGSARIAQATVDDALRVRDAQIAELSQSVRRQSEDNFVRQIEANFPGFLSGISPGGDKEKAWSEYKRNNDESIAAAMSRFDFPKLEYHIRSFYRSVLGVPAPSGREYAAPDPRNIGGTSPNLGGGRTFTVQEYKSTLEKASDDFHDGRITLSKYNEITDGLDNALREGRVR